MLDRSFLFFASYGFVAAALVISLLMFLSLKREILRLRGRLKRLDFTDRLNAMNLRIENAEQQAARTPLPPPVRASINLTRRSQVVRLSKRGESVETISAALALPRREVELLLKVHRAAAAAAAAGQTTA
jgi:hypothetical protein